MSALAEALLAAQRQAVGTLAKAYVAGTTLTPDIFLDELDRIGLRDDVDQGLLLEALTVTKQYGGEAPKPTGQTNGPKMPEQATPAQMKYIRQLCDDKGTVVPDVVASKEQASEIIEALKAGTYNADAYSVPF